MAALRVIFMGTPDFAALALQSIVENTNHNIVAVYSQPPRPKGRGQHLQKSATHLYAESQAIDVYTPHSLKSSTEQARFADLNADIAIVAAYGLILPQAILDLPEKGCVNIHGSLLPKWRGAAPIQRSILAGDKETGITLMQMDLGLDTGAMIAKETTPITPTTTASDLHDILAHIGGNMICKFLDQTAQGTIPPFTAQDDTQSSYAQMLSREDGRVNWTDHACYIERQFRALTPWPGVWTELRGKRLKLHQAEIQQDIPTEIAQIIPGKILNKTGAIACGDKSILRLKKIQPAGKNAMDFVSALNGGYLKIGDVLT